jgi:drug/metabolite transporter (DMT)-like permease
MTLWLWITLAAAAMQTVRFMLQKQLKGIGLSTGGATFSRFVFAAPIAAVAAATLLALGPAALPNLSGRFWLFAVVGGAAQVAATFLTVALFSLRNFAVGVAFTKTETVQVAVFSALILSEQVGLWGWIAIFIGFAGVLLLSRHPAGGDIITRASLYGVLAGGLFGISAIGYRGATLELMPLDFLSRAVVTLAFVTAMQTVGTALYLMLREPGELRRVAGAWRRTVWVGVTGVLGSAGWFTAFSLQNAAYVRAVGQVEIVFMLGVSVLVFHEKLTPREAMGIAMVIASVVLIVLGAAR